MVASKALRQRIVSDARASDFWSVPKGQAINEDNWERIAGQLRILSEFQTVPWKEAQPKFVRQLVRQRLIDPYKDHTSGFSAIGRMQLPVWRFLGLAWINRENGPEVTEIGRRFVASKTQDRRRLLAVQLLRYQFYNPSVAKHFRDFRIFPVIGLYRLMSQTNWRLTWDEFQLFGTRTRSFEDADELALLVDEWRHLSTRERDQLLVLATTIQAESHVKSEEGTTWGKVGRDINYIRAALRILPSLQHTDRGVEIPSSQRRAVNTTVLKSARTAEFIEYASEEDWLALYGQEAAAGGSRGPWTTVSEAQTYYERIGKIDAATDAFARQSGNRGGREIETYRSIQVLEKVLEDVLEHNLDKLESGLKLKGRQYSTAVGPIDILAEDQNGLIVVIELKRGRESYPVVGQIAKYLTWAADRLAQGKKSRVRGIIVGKDFDKHFTSAVKQVQHVSTYTFDLKVLFERWPRMR